MSEPSYPFDEFLKHLEEITKSGKLQPHEWEVNVIRVNELIRPMCSDERERMFKLTRFVFIMQFVSNHVDDLDQADYAVFGSEKAGALVGTHVLQAVHEIYTTRDISTLGHGPTVAEVMKLADRYRKSSSH